MKKHGVVLKRPVGSDGPFGEHAELPKNLGESGRKMPPSNPSPRKAKLSSAQPDKAADKKAAQAREQAARQKERDRRQHAVEKAQAALEEAKSEHAKRAEALRVELEAIEKKVRSEDSQWDDEEKRLREALRRARD
jgi:hypothetical protein